ncbi:MAG: hypothetical protein M0R70_12620 [Nitrospirae bacterium]|nr:hypothetical protein [Nitrospirota bacterium]
MKIKTIILLAVFLYSVPAWGATYYVDYANGRESNTGTSSDSPWKTLSFVDGKVSDGDTINLTAPATAPFRSDYFMQIFNSITTQGAGGIRAYILGTTDVSAGAVIGEQMRNWNMDGWYDATTPWKHVGYPTGVVSRNATYYTSAPYAASIDRISADAFLIESVYLNSLTNYTLSFQHREPTSGINLRLKIKKDSAAEYLARPTVSTCANNGSGLVRVTLTAPYDLINGTRAIILGVLGTTEANGTWTITVIDTTHFDLVGSSYANAYTSGGNVYTWVAGTSSFLLYENILLNANASFLPYSIFIPVVGSDVYNITVRNPVNSTSIIVDDLSLLPNTTTHSWGIYNGTTYKLNKTTGVEITALLKTTPSQWTSSGVDALIKVTKGATKNSLNAGEFIWDTEVLYYRLANEESDITNIHFEATQRYSVDVPEVASLVNYSGNDGVIKNIDIVGAKQSAILQTAGSLSLNNVNIKHCGGDGASIAGTLLSRNGSMLLSGNGWVTTGGGVCKLIRPFIGGRVFH